MIDRLRAQGVHRLDEFALTPPSRLLNHAVRRGAIAVNPISRLERTERPAVWTAKQKILRREQIAQVLDGAPPRFRTLLATAIFTGLRQGGSY